MDNKQLARTLGSLMLLDFDAAHAFEEAIENTEVKDVQEQFTLFRKDHQDHVFHISKMIVALGEEPPAHSTDFRVFSTKEIVSPRAASNTEERMRIMLLNETTLNDRYAEALRLDLPANIRSSVSHYFSDEQKHRAYISSALNLSPLPR